MEIDSLVRALSHQSLLALESSEQLVTDVLRYAQTHAKNREAYWYHKQLLPVDVGSGGLRTSPARVLHELGVATTLLTASPLSQVARHWAAVRYCATLTRTKRGLLALTPDANEVVYHHKVTQSEQLGIGLALVVAKHVLRRQFRGWTFHAVDAEVALKAGFVDGGGAVESVSPTKKRPDYILLGHHATKTRRRMKIVILECKGTHQSPSFLHGQLARAAVQVEALSVGGRHPPSLMVASHLTQAGITAYVLDPPGDGELWSGDDAELDGLLSTRPEDRFWRPRTATPADIRSEQPPSGPPVPAGAAGTEPAEELPPGAPQVFDVPEPERGWFTQILTRAVAATALLFAGNSATAGDYATPRQRGTEDRTSQPVLFDLDPAWATSSATTLALPNGISAEGTRHRAPLGGGRVLEVFCGVESHLYRGLTDGRISAYLCGTPRPSSVGSRQYRSTVRSTRTAPTGPSSSSGSSTTMPEHSQQRLSLLVTAGAEQKETDHRRRFEYSPFRFPLPREWGLTNVVPSGNGCSTTPATRHASSRNASCSADGFLPAGSFLVCPATRCSLLSGRVVYLFFGRGVNPFSTRGIYWSI
ncbi:hypothetical protein [Micromonospora rifamycinica]|uniref:Uncharacterized protein n=1 Tax=Micromonospora rifamycinica TaxID=291594 RepID=A0A1C5H303_9ACTN|nr:hypothetical protein [Micromonospora rifamycinica]SCG40257.1 hypothetical protein GA0070623_0647 [Micromonospora rifamycinica]